MDDGRKVGKKGFFELKFKTTRLITFDWLDENTHVVWFARRYYYNNNNNNSKNIAGGHSHHQRYNAAAAAAAAAAVELLSGGVSASSSGGGGDSLASCKKRKRRTSFTPHALELLNGHFERNTHPSGKKTRPFAKVKVRGGLGLPHF